MASPSALSTVRATTEDARRCLRAGGLGTPAPSAPPLPPSSSAMVALMVSAAGGSSTAAACAAFMSSIAALRLSIAAPCFSSDAFVSDDKVSATTSRGVSRE